MKDHSEQSPGVEYDCLGETVRAAVYCIITFVNAPLNSNSTVAFGAPKSFHT
jgi:hypothetical protein